MRAIVKDKLIHYKLDTGLLLQHMTNAPDLTPTKWDEIYFYSDKEVKDNQSRMGAK
jgi:hypothetical protein